MPIQNDEELNQKLNQASLLLQEIQDYVGRDFTKPAKIRFPTGFIRPARQARTQLTFLPNSPFKSNLSYALMLLDVQHWLLARTNITGTAKEMVIKLQIFLIGTIVESITKVHLRGVCGGNYKRRTEYMANNAMISNELRTELDWLWDMRNLIHLFKVEEHEWLANNYSVANHNRAVKAIKDLLSTLN